MTLHRWAIYTPDHGGIGEGGRGDVGLRGVRGTAGMNKFDLRPEGGAKCVKRESTCKTRSLKHRNGLLTIVGSVQDLTTTLKIDVSRCSGLWRLPTELGFQSLPFRV